MCRVFLASPLGLRGGAPVDGSEPPAVSFLHGVSGHLESGLAPERRLPAEEGWGISRGAGWVRQCHVCLDPALSEQPWALRALQGPVKVLGKCTRRSKDFSCTSSQKDFPIILAAMR